MGFMLQVYIVSDNFYVQTLLKISKLYLGGTLLSDPVRQ